MKCDLLVFHAFAFSNAPCTARYALVSNALEDRTGVARPDISNENLILNELIREYLVFNR
jgi:hypothetical protein